MTNRHQINSFTKLQTGETKFKVHQPCNVRHLVHTYMYTLSLYALM